MSYLPMLQGSHRSRATVLTDSQLQAITESLPTRCRDADRWKLCYSTLEHGVSINTFYHNVAGFENVVLIIMTDRGAVFGAFSPEPLHVETGRRYFGSRGTFLFHFAPAGFRSYRWARNNDYFVYCTHDCIGFGGGSNFGILVESSLSSGSTGSCETFDSPALIPLRTDDSTATFVIYALEVWHVPEYSGTLLHFDSPATPTSKGKGERSFKDLKAAKAARKFALRKTLDWLTMAGRLPALTRILTAFVAIAISLVAYSRARPSRPAPPATLTSVNLSHHLRSGTAFKQTPLKPAPPLDAVPDADHGPEGEAEPVAEAPQPAIQPHVPHVQHGGGKRNTAGKHPRMENSTAGRQPPAKAAVGPRHEPAAKEQPPPPALQPAAPVGAPALAVAPVGAREHELPERHRLAVEPDARVAGPQPPAATVTPVPAVVVVPNPQGTRARAAADPGVEQKKTPDPRPARREGPTVVDRPALNPTADALAQHTATPTHVPAPPANVPDPPALDRERTKE